MANDEISVVDILAKEGIGLFAFELETLHPDLETTSLAKLLATVIQESGRLPDWWHQSSGQVSVARECNRLAHERIKDLATEKCQDHHHLLIIGYLYGRLTLPSREVIHKLIQAEEKVKKNEKREELRKAGLKEVESDREEGRLWMRERAAEIWKEDHAEELTLSKMAAKVHALVKEESAAREASRDESSRRWPQSLEKIKDAIRPAAPEYASKRGRPRKK